jgi:hypothetical protein
MAAILELLPIALRYARAGLSANGFYRAMKAQDVGGRRSEILDLYKNARNIVSHSGAEAFKDINGTPDPAQLTGWPTKTAAGIKQTVTLLYRDKITGKVVPTYWNTVSDQPLSRAEAVRRAMTAYAANNDSYGTDIIGAVHTSAYRLVPEVT